MVHRVDGQGEDGTPSGWAGGGWYTEWIGRGRMVHRVDGQGEISLHPVPVILYQSYYTV